MQLVVDDSRRHRQQQALRAATLFLFCTGFGAGLTVALGLELLGWAGHWQNTAVVWVLPLTMAFGNAQMLLMTDLRIRRRLHWVTAMNIAALPIYSGFLFLLQGFGVRGLLLVFGAMALASVVNFVFYWLLVKPGWRAGLRWQFLPAALRLGLPVMLGLLLKYATDMLVHTSMRWVADPTTAGDWGRIVRVLEPFGGMYFIALMMAWGPNAVLIAGPRGPQEARTLERAALWTLGICLAGIPLAVVWAYGVFYFIPQTEPTGTYAWLIFAAVVSRTAAFSAMAMAGYANVLNRNYKILPALYLLELGLTALILLWGVGRPALNPIFLALIFSCWVPVACLLLAAKIGTAPSR